MTRWFEPDALGEFYRLAEFGRRETGRLRGDGERLVSQCMVGGGGQERAVHPAGVGDDDAVHVAQNGA